MSSKKTEVRSIRLDPDQQKRLDIVAAQHGINPAELIRLGLDFVLPLAEKEPLKVKILLVTS